MGMTGTFLMAYGFSRVLLRVIDRVADLELRAAEHGMKLTSPPVGESTEVASGANLFETELSPNHEELPWTTGLTEENLQNRWDPMTERPLEF
jgi:hypothetical protein